MNDKDKKVRVNNNPVPLSSGLTKKPIGDYVPNILRKHESTEEQQQYAQMDRLHELSIASGIPINVLSTHELFAGNITEATVTRINFDDYFQPTWREIKSQIVYDVFMMHVLGLIQITEAYSLSDFEMIIQPTSIVKKLSNLKK